MITDNERAEFQEWIEKVQHTKTKDFVIEYFRNTNFDQIQTFYYDFLVNSKICIEPTFEQKKEMIEICGGDFIKAKREFLKRFVFYLIN